jgi:hypothetical protein
MIKRDTTNLLRAVLKALEALDEAEMEQVLQGKGRLKFVGLESRGTPKRVRGKTPIKIRMATEELQALAQQLRSCKTREEAMGLLRKDNHALLKESLAKLARLLGIHINKSDRREKIEDKIVEFAVGAKLRSEAIRTLSLKQS